jgi:DNA-binding ferritin-like protein (Dps family)
MVTLFRDERSQDSPEVQAKIERLQNDFPTEVKDLARDLLALSMLAGVANTRILIGSLLDRIESMADIQQ